MKNNNLLLTNLIKYFFLILSIPLILLLSIWDDISSDSSVLYLFQCLVWNMSLLLVPAVSSIGSIFLFDVINTHAKNAVKSYRKCFSSISFFSIVKKYFALLAISTFTAFIGFIIFISLVRLFLPWENNNESVYSLFLQEGNFRAVLSLKQWIKYYSLFSLQFSLLSGFLTLLSHTIVYILFPFQKEISYFLPLVIYYIWEITIGRYKEFDLNYIFNGTYRVWSKDWQCITYALIFYIITFIVSITVIYFYNIRQKREKNEYIKRS